MPATRPKNLVFRVKGILHWEAHVGHIVLKATTSSSGPIPSEALVPSLINRFLGVRVVPRVAERYWLAYAQRAESPNHLTFVLRTLCGNQSA
jgi:hypothetical protein